MKVTAAYADREKVNEYKMLINNMIACSKLPKELTNDFMNIIYMASLESSIYLAEKSKKDKDNVPLANTSTLMASFSLAVIELADEHSIDLEAREMAEVHKVDDRIKGDAEIMEMINKMKNRN